MVIPSIMQTPCLCAPGHLLLNKYVDLRHILNLSFCDMGVLKIEIEYASIGWRRFVL